VNGANSVLSWVSTIPVTFESRPWPTLLFELGTRGCDVMPSLQDFMFRLRGGVVNATNYILSPTSINPLTFESRRWPTLVSELGTYKLTLICIPSLI
jgi:hypothetical protein